MKARLDRRARREKARHQLARDPITVRIRNQCTSVWAYSLGEVRCLGIEGHSGLHSGGGSAWFHGNREDT